MLNRVAARPLCVFLLSLPGGAAEPPAARSRELVFSGMLRGIARSALRESGRRRADGKEEQWS